MNTGDYLKKQQIQFLLFPEGITYSKKNDGCRTTRVNSVFAHIAGLAQVLRHKKSGIPELNLDYAALVGWTGERSNLFDDLKAINNVCNYQFRSLP
jgi:hypothetical protein